MWAFMLVCIFVHLRAGLEASLGGLRPHFRASSEGLEPGLGAGLSLNPGPCLRSRLGASLGPRSCLRASGADLSLEPRLKTDLDLRPCLGLCLGLGPGLGPRIGTALRGLGPCLEAGLGFVSHI